MNYENEIKELDSLSDREKLQWLIENVDNEVYQPTIFLEKNEPFVVLETFPDGNNLFYFRSRFGRDDGVFLLFEFLGIKAEHV